MTLIINNHDVEQVLTMEDTLAALEDAYLQLARKEAEGKGREEPHKRKDSRPAQPSHQQRQGRYKGKRHRHGKGPKSYESV